MEKFVEFFQKFYESQYLILMQKLITEKVPCGIFLPFNPAEVQISLVNQYRRVGINLTTIVTADENTFDVPNDPTSNIPPKYVFVLQNFPTDLVIPKLIELGMEPIHIEPSGNTQPAVDFHIKHMHEIFDVYQDLIDDESREALLGYVLARISKRISFCKFSNNVQYILDGFIPKRGEVMIDVGVCDGSTSAIFADFGCRVIGFEMDSENYKLASKLAEKKNFTVENLGLGDENREVGYFRIPGNQGGSFVGIDGRKIPDDSPKTQLVTLDSYVQDHHLDSVDFIKMDTEGAELSILKGATNTITRFKPILALSAYHKPEDIFTLCQFLKTIRPDYKFAFRHYKTTPDNNPFIFTEQMINLARKLDLKLSCPNIWELVLFAR